MKLTHKTVAALALFIVSVFFIRRLFRNHRLGKAEYPPPSPLLPNMEDTLLPPGIARSISQRSKGSISSLGSFDDGEKGGERYQNHFAIGRAIGGGEGFGREGEKGGYTEVGNVSPLSPLPRAKVREEEVVVDGVGLSLMPRNPVKREERVGLQGEEIKEKVFELA